MVGRHARSARRSACVLRTTVALRASGGALLVRGRHRPAAAVLQAPGLSGAATQRTAPEEHGKKDQQGDGGYRDKPDPPS